MSEHREVATSTAHSKHGSVYGSLSILRWWPIRSENRNGRVQVLFWNPYFMKTLGSLFSAASTPIFANTIWSIPFSILQYVQHQSSSSICIRFTHFEFCTATDSKCLQFFDKLFAKRSTTSGISRLRKKSVKCVPLVCQMSPDVDKLGKFE